LLASNPGTVNSLKNATTNEAPMNNNLLLNRSFMVEFFEEKASWKIPEIHLEPDVSSVKGLWERSEPIIIRQSHLTHQWKATKLWKQKDYIIEKIKTSGAKSVIISPQNVLIYSDSKKTKSWMFGGKEIPGFNLTQLPAHKTNDLKGEIFLADIKNHSDGKFVYMVSNEGKGNLFDWMVNDLTPVNHFQVDWNQNPKKKGPIIKRQVWIGSPGLISSLHYDASHNFFSQLQGVKSLVLFPPEEVSKVQLYPWLSGRCPYAITLGKSLILSPQFTAFDFFRFL